MISFLKGLPIFNIDLITSLACIEPAIPASVDIIPSLSQFWSWEGSVGIKHLRHGPSFLKSKLKIYPSYLLIAEEIKTFLYLIQ